MSSIAAAGREWWAALTSEWGPWVISWRIWAGLALTRILSASVLFSGRYDMTSVRSVTLVAAAYCVAGLVMAAAGITVLRHRRSRPPSPATVVGVWLLAGLAYSLTLSLTLPRAGGDVDTTITGAIISPTLLFVAKQAVLVAFVTSFLAGIRYAGELRKVIDRQEELLAQTEPYVTELRERNIEALRSLQPAFAQLRLEVDKYLLTDRDDALSELPERLASFGRVEVRELSHRVAAGEFGASIERTIPIHPSTRSTALSVLRSSLTFAPYALFTAGWYLLVVVAWLPAPTPAELRIVFAECLVIVVQLTVARLLLAQLPLSEQVARLCIVLVTCLGTIVGVMLVHAAAGGTRGTGLTLLEIISAVVGSLLLTGAYRHQRVVLTGLAEASATLAAQLHHLRREGERIRHRIAQLLHGTVQGRLALVAARISELCTMGTAGDRAAAREEIHAILTSIESEFAAAEALTGADDSTPALETSLVALAQEWDGLLTITWTLHPDARDALAARPLLTREVADILTEAVLNARRHGDATEVAADIAIARRNPLTLRLTVSNDGDLPTTSFRPGLGSSTLASLGAQWALARDEHGRTVLVVALLAPAEDLDRPPNAVITDDRATTPLERIRA